MTSVFPNKARELILSGNAPDGMVVRGEKLDLSGCTKLISLPENLEVTWLDLSECTSLSSLPNNIQITDTLNLSGCTSITRIPNNLHLRTLNLSNCTNLTSLPENLQVDEWLNISGCIKLTELPRKLKTRILLMSDCKRVSKLPNNILVQNHLVLSGCTELTSLPNNLNIPALNLSGCTKLTSLPNDLHVEILLNLSNCSGLESLPNRLKTKQLILQGCTSITKLSDNIEIESLNLDSTNESLIHSTSVKRLEQIRVIWNGVEVPVHTLKHPERLTPQQIIEEPNSEVRRVMLERYGEQKFIENLGAEPVHQDKYGVLYRVELPDDEPLVMVKVQDASTDREYFLRVPPDMQTAHEAVAWTFGMSPNEYHPDIET